MIRLNNILNEWLNEIKYTPDQAVKILSKLDNDIIIAVQQNNVLGTSFHPELTNDYSWHEYFIKLIENKST